LPYSDPGFPGDLSSRRGLTVHLARSGAANFGPRHHHEQLQPGPTLDARDQTETMDKDLTSIGRHKVAPKCKGAST